MRSSILFVLVTVAGLAGLAGCDARPASEGGNPAPDTGAHTAHLTGVLAQPIACSQCHDSAFEVTLSGSLATANGAVPAYSKATKTCSNVYCHDGGPDLLLGGGTFPSPVWNPPSPVVCGGCHALPGGAIDTPWHPAVAANVDCGACHVGYSRTTVVVGTHVNGVVNVRFDPDTNYCAACHGDAARVLAEGTPAEVQYAPPVDRNGSSDTAQAGVGAHQSHLLPGASAISNPVACSECHVLPPDLTHVGPALTTPATLTWGPLATANGVTASFDATAVTCANYCHGATLTGGAITQPRWTTVNGTQAACGTCHGNPPTSGMHVVHATPGQLGVSCGVCHPTGYSYGVVGAGVIPIHLNGAVDMNPQGFSNWNPDAPGIGGWRGTATGCHGGTRYWTPGTLGTCG